MNQRVIAALILIFSLLAISRAYAEVDLCAEYAAVGKPEEIIRECTAQIEGVVKARNIARSYLNRGLAYQMTNQYDKAVVDFTKAIEEGPEIR